MTQKLSQVLAFCVIGIAYLVILNAYVSIPILREQLLPGIGADFGDGLAFFFSGIITYVITTGTDRSNIVADLLLPTSVLVLFLLMATLVTSALLGLHLDISSLLAGNDAALLESATRTLPWLEVIGFCLVALGGLNVMLRSQFNRHAPLVLGGILVVTHGLGVIGHLMQTHWMTGSISGISVATSPLSAALLIVIGFAFLLSALPSRST